jgi:hypothetical protein
MLGSPPANTSRARSEEGIEEKHTKKIMNL